MPSADRFLGEFTLVESQLAFGELRILLSALESAAFSISPTPLEPGCTFSLGNGARVASVTARIRILFVLRGYVHESFRL
jgi:hypothetical protein